VVGDLNALEKAATEGESPVLGCRSHPIRYPFIESGCLRVQPKVGGILHPKLNIDTRPIANKYCEGKMQRTLKRELKVRETVEREADGRSFPYG